MERAALNRWSKGDPSGFLEISAPDVVYFDPYVEKRLDGFGQLRQWYEGLRGQIRIDRYELLNPRVHCMESSAVLTFNFVSWTDGKEDRWNCTEVYRHSGEEWRIIQTHWSRTLAGD